MKTIRWPVAPQQEYMLASLAFKTTDPNVRFRNPFLALKVTGPFDVDRLAAAVDALARHHSVLRVELDATTRTSMRLRDDAGAGYFEFDPQCVSLDVALAEQEWQVFEVTKSPLWRVKVIRVGLQTHVVSLTFCHLIWDGVSMRAFLDLLSCEYAAPGSTVLPQQYDRFIETAERERTDRRSMGLRDGEVLAAIADAIQERRQLRAEATTLDAQRVAFSIGRHGMNNMRLISPSCGAPTPFYAVLQTYLCTAAEAFGRHSIVTAFATSRLDLRPGDDCLGYFSDFTLGVYRTDTLIDGEEPTSTRHFPRMSLLIPALSWSELTANVGAVAYPQEIYDVWARGPVFADASDLAEVFTGAQAAVVSLTPSWRMALRDASQRRVLGGHVIPSIIIDDLRDGTGYLEFNAAIMSRRRVRALVEDFLAGACDGQRR
jgi:hypothetical protein